MNSMNQFILKNSSATLNTNISLQNGRVIIKCEEVYFNKIFMFSLNEEEIKTFTQKSFVVMSSQEFYELIIKNTIQNDYLIDYDNKQNSLKIMLKIKFEYLQKERFRNMGISFICQNPEKTEIKFKKPSISDGFVLESLNNLSIIEKPFEDSNITVVSHKVAMTIPKIRLDKTKKYKFECWIQRNPNVHSTHDKLYLGFFEYDKNENVFLTPEGAKRHAGQDIDLNGHVWCKIELIIDEKSYHPNAEFIAPAFIMNFNGSRDTFLISKVIIYEINN